MGMDDYQRHRSLHSNKSTVRTVLAADDSTDHADVITPKSANHQIYIQKIHVLISTHADQSVTFQDDASTPVVLASFLDEATVVPTVPSSWTFDFGPAGKPLTIAENLDIIFSAAGIAGTITIEAYEKLGQVIAYDSGASLQ